MDKDTRDDINKRLEVMGQFSGAPVPNLSELTQRDIDQILQSELSLDGKAKAAYRWICKARLYRATA